MKRVIVIGCGGAGKSTFSKNISNKLDIPVYHLDKFFGIRVGFQHQRMNLIIRLQN